MLQRPASLLTILLALSARTRSQGPPSTLSDEQINEQSRRQSLGTSFLAQLGLDELPPKSNVTVVVPPEVKAEFDLISEIVNFTSKERQPGSCQSTEFFAQPVSTFVGVTNKYTGTVTHRSAKSIEERTRSVHDPSTLLNQVTVLFNFNLGSDLSLITQASLMLYQIPASNSDYVRDEEQYVEVSSITPARSGHLATMIIAGSFVNVFDQGPLVFDITTAVEQWIAMGTRGKLDLIISTYCFGSPLCAQPDGYRIPKSFKFAKASPSSENAPRIIVLSSTNPLESRTKRQAEEVGATSCIEGQTLCCLMPFIINFVQDLGEAFSMIRDPPLYQANFCEGICPTTAGGQLMVPAVFSYISQLENNPASSLTPCCAGYTYDSLPVLLDMGGTLEARVFENVVVASCTCS